jgi:hypothetical protein
MKLNDLFEAIGPHSQDPNQELIMMMQGKKPAAILSSDDPSNLPQLKEFIKLAKQGMFNVWKIDKGKFTMWFFGQTYSPNAEQLYNIYKQNDKLTPELHEYVGTLLGYSGKDIQEFRQKNETIR